MAYVTRCSQVTASHQLEGAVAPAVSRLVLLEDLHVPRHQLGVVLVDELVARRVRLRADDRLAARDEHGLAVGRAQWPAEAAEEGGEGDVELDRDRLQDAEGLGLGFGLGLVNRDRLQHAEGVWWGGSRRPESLLHQKALSGPTS